VHLSTPELVIMIVVFARLAARGHLAPAVWLTLPVLNDLEGLIARAEAAKEPLSGGETGRLRLAGEMKLSGVHFRYDKKRGPDVLDARSQGHGRVGRRHRRTC
jgi:hypothetical protein